jgi:hypothetical protein
MTHDELKDTEANSQKLLKRIEGLLGGERTKGKVQSGGEKGWVSELLATNALRIRSQVLWTTRTSR